MLAGSARGIVGRKGGRGWEEQDDINGYLYWETASIEVQVGMLFQIGG